MSRLDLTTFVLLALSVPMVQAQNRIQVENALPGSNSWPLTNPASNHEIEGYASLTSVNVGGQIGFYVNTASSTFSINVFRMGWYGGAGARLMSTVAGLTGVLQTAPIPDPNTGMVECNWQQNYSLSIPSIWTSGVFLAQLTASSGKQSYIIFVVRDDSRPSTYLAQEGATTFQAYNNWGGGSLYPFNSTSSASGGPSTMVSFNRPYTIGFTTNSYLGVGAGEFLTNVQQETIYASGWEYNLVRFLEREGYDTTYCTDVDLDEQPSLLLSHAAWLSMGHDEYWSMAMRTNVTNARNAGVSLAFMGANAMYWQIRFATSSITGAADRTIICYKDATNDPVQGPTTTILWRDLGMPEESIIGQMYHKDPYFVDLVIMNGSNPVFAGTGLSTGSVVPQLVGYEVDCVQDINYACNAPGYWSPPGTVQLGHSPLDQSGAEWGDMTIYTWTSGATVFSTGSNQFAWGLDNDYFSPAVRPSYVSPGIQQMMRNVLTTLVANSITISISPTQPVTLTGGQTEQYAASESGGSNTSVTWSATPTSVGSISAAGLYTAPSIVSSLQTVSVTATTVGTPTHSASVTLTLIPVAVTVGPSSVSLAAGQSQTFTATVTGSSNTAITWSTVPSSGSGTISASGGFTAPSVIASQQTVTIVATSAADPTKSGSTTLTLLPVAVTIAPTTVTLGVNQTQTFTSNVTNASSNVVTWTLSPSIGSFAGTTYTAPASISTAQTVNLTATSTVDATKSATAVINLAPVGVSVQPTSVSLGGGGTVSIAATVIGAPNQSVTWSLSPTGVGSVTGGLYTAPSIVNTAQSVSVIATSNADNTKSATTTVSLMPVAITAGPQSMSLSVNQTLALTATVSWGSTNAVTWSILNGGPGSISPAGVYTAPSTIGSSQIVTVQAASVANTAKIATVTINLTPVTISVNPPTTTLNPSQTVQLTGTVIGSSNIGVTWNILNGGPGTVSPSGLYTAPASIATSQTVIVQGTSSADPTKTATASITLTPPLVTSVSRVGTPVICALGGNVSSGSCNYSATTGNFLVVTCSSQNSQTNVKVTDSMANTYTQDGTATNGLTTSLFHAANITGGAVNPTCKGTGTAGNGLVITVTEYAGVLTSNPVDGTSSATGSGTAADSGAISTAGARDLLVGAAMGNSVPNCNSSIVGSGWNLIQFENNQQSYCFLYGDRLNLSAGSYHFTSTLTNSNDWAAVEAGYK